METYIVKLRRDKSDLLSEESVEIPSTPSARRAAFSTLEQRFRQSASKLTGVLADQQHLTRKNYRWLFEKMDAGGFDVLSAGSVSEAVSSGLLSYEPLVVSNAYAVTATEDVFARIMQLDGVQEVHPNYVMELPGSGEETLARSTPLSHCSQLWHHTHLGVPSAHQLSTGRSVSVAVLDTGLDASHPEFSHMSLAGHAEWDDLGIQVPSAQLTDTHSHGTHVTGILCGASVGIAPDIDLYVGTVAPSGFTTFAQLGKGFDWAASNGVDVVSVSLGKTAPVFSLEYEIDNLAFQGILVVVAAGNDGPGQIRCPGNCRHSLTVGAVDANNQVWTRSGGGRVVGTPPYWKPEVYAPGVDICSCVPHGGYAVKSGTSMATPMVAGVAALIKGRSLNLSFPNLVDVLRRRSVNIPIPATLGTSGLLVSAARAVT